MTRRAGIIVLAASVTVVSAATHEGTVHAFATIIKAPASFCHPINGGAWTPQNPQIMTTEAYVGRLAGIGKSLKVYCPVADLPTVLDLTDLQVADRVSILYYKSNSTVIATAQLCSEDNLGWSIGGSCDNAAASQVGSGTSTVELSMTAGTNWQVNAWSLHYIYVYVPGFAGGDWQTISLDVALFSGYTIWHS